MKRIKQFTLFVFTAIAFSTSVQAQGYPLRSIEEVQFVLKPGTDDTSFLLGDTIEVRGLVMSDVRALTPGSGWACFVADPSLPTEAWQGLLIVQNDTTVSATQFGTLQTGMVCRFTGVVRETETFTQLVLLTDPAVQVIIESAGNILPPAIQLNTADLTNRQNGEQWEGQLVRIMDAEVTDNAVSSNRAQIQDNSALPAYVDDYFVFFNASIAGGSYSWPPSGSSIDVTGFVRGLDDGLSINPRTFSDLIVESTAPLISDVSQSPVVPKDDDDVQVSATITDNNEVAAATLFYSVDWAPWSSVPMGESEDTWTAEIPKQEDGSFLRYFISATDNEGFNTLLPADTSVTTGSIFRFVVRNNGPLIADVQNTYGYERDESGYQGYIMQLQGAVMSSPLHFPGYYIQDDAAAWSGIFVSGLQQSFQIGDWITVTGRIVEDFGLTKLQATSAELLVEGFGAYAAVPMQTGALATDGSMAEAFESVYVSFNNVTVTDAFPDEPNNFGEFIIDDGSGGLRVDDESEQYEGNLTLQISDGFFGSIRGIHFYSFGDFKLAPRDSGDVSLVTGFTDNVKPVSGFTLQSNYPNPFNPETQIRFILPQAADLKITIYNSQGQKVRVLQLGMISAGQQQVAWDGRDDGGINVAGGVYFYQVKAGDLIQNGKMLLLK